MKRTTGKRWSTFLAYPQVAALSPLEAILENSPIHPSSDTPPSPSSADGFAFECAAVGFLQATFLYWILEEPLSYNYGSSLCVEKATKDLRGHSSARGGHLQGS